jgi:hypothetical protein
MIGKGADMRRVFLLAALLLTGCGGGNQPKFADLHPTSGTVLSGNKPVSGGMVQFRPEPDNPDFMITSVVADDGTFKLSTVRSTDSSGERRSGAPAGKYRVTFTPRAGDQTSGYTAPVTLPVPVTVEAKSNDLKLTLPKR